MSYVKHGNATFGTAGRLWRQGTFSKEGIAPRPQRPRGDRWGIQRATTNAFLYAPPRLQFFVQYTRRKEEEETYEISKTETERRPLILVGIAVEMLSGLGPDPCLKDLCYVENEYNFAQKQVFVVR